MLPHVENHITSPNLKSDNTLHVIGVISNPMRWNSRLRIAREWMKRMEKTPNVELYMVELAYGDFEFEVTSADNPKHLQLRTDGRNVIWHKENMINLGVRELFPRGWKYMAWMDTDVFYRESNQTWAQETIQALQHYHVVQPWKDCADLGPRGDIMLDQYLRPIVHTSFGCVHDLGVPKQTAPNQPYKYSHSGFAWACDRLFWENVEGLMERCIIGSADHLMAWAMIGGVENAIHGLLPDSFKAMAKAWQDKAYFVTRGMMGFLPVPIDHWFHGSKKTRYYRERNEIFVAHKLDPVADLARDDQGLLYLKDKPGLIDEIIKYNKSRQEDSVTE